MNPSTRRKVITAGCVAVVVVAGVAVFHGGGKNDNLVTTTMADVGPLEVGGEVRSAGVQVGTVKSISLVNNQARVTLAVDSGVLPLHVDATITLRPINILGEDYIDLNAGTDSKPFATSNDIPMSRTRVAGTIQDLLSTFQAPTAAALGTVVTAAGEGLDGNGANTAKTLETLTGSMDLAQKLGGLLSAQNESLSQLVGAADPIAAALATKGGSSLDSLIGSTTSVLNAVTTQQEALKATLDQLPATLASAQSTLAQFGGVADQAAPAVAAIRPLTDNLSSVVTELDGFTKSANPALSSLPPLLSEASSLLDQAAPVVAALRQSAPGLVRTTASLRPISDQLLEKNIDGLMAFVRKWALSTNGYDGLSHYFRGVVYVSPSVLNQLLTSLLPSGISLGGATIPLSGVTAPLSGLTSSLTGTLGSTLSGLVSGTPLGSLTTGLSSPGGLLGALLNPSASSSGTKAKAAPQSSGADVLGLTSTQEQSMLSQLFGGQ